MDRSFLDKKKKWNLKEEKDEAKTKCKTRENSNFLKNGKIVISAENPEFF